MHLPTDARTAKLWPEDLRKKAYMCLEFLNREKRALRDG